ncbi:MAG TPA: hypothetical protein VD770_02595 [Coxiellaceae bacterium]|nr:hypothetical protein [Coxiellaceae bacterium]
MVKQPSIHAVEDYSFMEPYKDYLDSYLVRFMSQIEPNKVEILLLVEGSAKDFTCYDATHQIDDHELDARLLPEFKFSESDLDRKRQSFIQESIRNLNRSSRCVIS